MKRLILMLLIFSLYGCSGTTILGTPRYIWRGAPDFEKISLGMTKEDVRKAIGPANLVRGAIYAKDGAQVEVWEYMEAIGEGKKRQYWLYFADGKLVKWGEAGDWRREADKIYEFRWR